MPTQGPEPQQSRFRPCSALVSVFGREGHTGLLRYRADVDIAALLVACLSLVVASLALGWQIASWHMDGPRVRLKLKQAVGGNGGIASAIVERNGKLRDMSTMRQQGWDGPDLIGVEVTNVGRSRVQVVRTAVELRRGGMTASFPRGNQWSPPLPHWVEPGTTETWFADIDDARALVSTTRDVVDNRAGGVHMSIELGDGRQLRTKRYLRL